MKIASPRAYVLLTAITLLLVLGTVGVPPAPARAQAFSCTGVTEIPQAECEALVALYNSTDGANWTDNTGWLSTNTPCSWRRVSCTDGHVLDLYLDSNQLSGSIPPELGNLSQLSWLCLGSNQLSGSIPPELGNLSQLSYLFLGNNGLSGSIPSELGNLSQLSELDLGSNQLSGGIPLELGNLSQLSELYLQGNQLSGGIPSELGNLSQLSYLFLGSNQLSGGIPSELGNLSQMQRLWLFDNQLSGSIPPELGNLSQLSYLDLRYNQLSGGLPPELGNLSQLSELYLQDNQVSGGIPPELGNLSQLSYLYLQGNQLSGSIPPELGNLSQLSYLYLSYNQLSGSIPPELGNLPQLGVLDLSSNQLSGSIPPALGDLSQLAWLHLGNNPFSGPLPLSLTNLTNLEHFYFDMTNLCEPPAPSFQAWLAGIDYVASTGVVCEPSRLSLELRTELGNWPPEEGQKLIANINFENTTGQAMNIQHIGVRGRRNGMDFWDIGFWSINLEAGQTWSFEANNERPLEPGNYSFRVSYSLDGTTWTEVGNEINFTVSGAGSGSPLIDPTRSTLAASPTTIEADGESAATVTITLKNAAGAALAGKEVELVSERGARDIIVQPHAPTDSQGRAVAQVRSVAPGASRLWAWVLADGVRIDTPVDITFSSLLNPVPGVLRSRSTRLVDQTGRSLDTMWDDAQAVVGEAAYFRGAVGEDAFRLTSNLVSGLADTFAGAANWRKGVAAGRLAFPGWESPAWASSGVCEISNAFIKDATSSIDNSTLAHLSRLALRGGLYYLTAQYQNECLGDLRGDLVVDSWNISNLMLTHLERPVTEWPIKKMSDESHTFLQARLDDLNATRIPPLSQSEIDRYAADLTARELALPVLENRLRDARLTLESVHQAHEADPWGGETLQTLLRLVAKGGATYALDGPGQVLVAAPLTLFDAYMDANALSESMHMAALANMSLLKTAPESMSTTTSNAEVGLRRIMAGEHPCTPQGEISNVQHFSQGSGLMGAFWNETKSYSTMTIKNTGGCPALFQVTARYIGQTTRLGVPWAQLWMHEEKLIELDPGQSGTVEITYRDGSHGYSPRQRQSLVGVGEVPASPLNIDLLAVNDTGTLWADGYYSHEWSPAKVSTTGLTLTTADLSAASTLPTIDQPLVVAAGGSLGQPYQSAYLWANNPFTATVPVTLTQPIPAGVTVVDAGTGQISGGDIVWSGLVTPLDSQVFTYTFNVSATAGQTVTLPAAHLEIASPQQGSFSISAAPDPFQVPSHITVGRSVPRWITPGSSATAVVTATNHLATPLSNGFSLKITDLSGAQVYYDSDQLLSLAGGASQELAYHLPALDIGDYLALGFLENEGANELMFSDPFSVGTTPPSLVTMITPVAQDRTVEPGSDLTFTVRAINTSGVELSGIVITSSIPADLVATPGSISHNGSQVGNNVQWNLSGLAAGGELNLTYTVHIPEDYVSQGEGRYVRSRATMESQESPTVAGEPAVVIVYSPSSELYLPLVLK